jgi:hypothetical protein
MKRSCVILFALLFSGPGLLYTWVRIRSSTAGVFDAYGKDARFFGVFDGDVANAKKWANYNQVAFPILSDPDLHTVHEYKAENSAYVALIAKGGTIEMLWPGYSVDMLADAAARLARLTGVIAKPIDAREAPKDMTTGCPY